MSIAELVVILIVALIAFGPKQLPVAARNLGRFIGFVNTTWQRLKSEFDSAQEQTLNANIAKAQAAENAETQTETGTETTAEMTKANPQHDR